MNLLLVGIPKLCAKDLENVRGHVAVIVEGTTQIDKVGLVLRRKGVQIKDVIAWYPYFIVIGQVPRTESYTEMYIRRGLGPLNIDAVRTPVGEDEPNRRHLTGEIQKKEIPSSFSFKRKLVLRDDGLHNSRGRWPANLVLTEENAIVLDTQSGDRPSNNCEPASGFKSGNIFPTISQHRSAGYDDEGGASRYFHKAETPGEIINLLRRLFVGHTEVVMIESTKRERSGDE